MSGLALKNIEFPPLLTTIGNKTFSRNYSLETLSLGNLVVAGDSCFNNLPLLKEVVLRRHWRLLEMVVSIIAGFLKESLCRLAR